MQIYAPPHRHARSLGNLGPEGRRDRQANDEVREAIDHEQTAALLPRSERCSPGTLSSRVLSISPTTSFSDVGLFGTAY